MRYALAFLLSLPAIPALAQTTDERDALVAEYYVETGQLRMALGQQMKLTLETRKELERLRREAAPKVEEK